MSVTSVVVGVGMQIYIPDRGFEHFVAKIQKVKTRKGKDYFVSRITIPKEIVNQIDVESGEYVFFKAKKAEWFHMLEWDNMKSTWEMLPNETKTHIVMDGLVNYGQEALVDEMCQGFIGGLGATNPGGTFPLIGSSMINARATR